MRARVGYSCKREEIRARVEADEFTAFGIPAKPDIAQGGVEKDLGVGFSALIGGTNGAKNDRFNGPSN